MFSIEEQKEIDAIVKNIFDGFSKRYPFLYHDIYYFDDPKKVVLEIVKENCN